ncbi:hypothetical protein CR513_12464, partial [Mucuna pruriens]
MLDLGASINVMPTSIYKSLSFGDLELTRMTIHLANISVVQPLGVLENVLVQVNELIFPTDFYVLDMEDETSGKGSTLILGRPFLMTTRTKIDVHAGTLSMEFGDTLVPFNIFEAMKHPAEDHSLFGIDLIEELVEEYFQLDNISEEIENLAEDTKLIDCPGSLTKEFDYDEVWEVHNLSNFEDDNIDLADLSQEAKLIKLLDQVCKYENPECSNKVVKTKKPSTAQVATMFASDYESAKGSRDQERIEVISAKKTKVDIMSAQLVPNPTQVDQLDPKVSIDNSSSPPPPMELKPLPIIITSNLYRKQEDQLLSVLRQHKKAIGWKLSDLLGINPSIYMHRILMEEESKPIRQQQRRMNPTILDVVKKEVTKLLVTGIIYPILDNQWVSLVQVVPKKSGMTITKNQHDELVPMRIQNNWRVCVNYRRLNQATRKDHFPFPFLDQVLKKLARKSHYCFLDGFSGYMQIHIAPKDQHKITFTCPFGTFAYTHMPFGLCNAPGTFDA